MNTNINMKAEEMFAEEGFEITSGIGFEYYTKLFDLGFIRITFDTEKRTLSIIDDSGFATYEMLIEDLPIPLRVAIDQRLKELGWLWGCERKYCFIV